MDFTMPYPEEPSEKTMPSPSEIRSVADWMADEYNEEAFEKEPYLAREILEWGGIAPFRKTVATEKQPEKAEYRSLPLFLRNKTGLTIDQMAAEMGYEYANDLVAAIQKEYPAKTKSQWKSKQRRKTPADFIDAAYEYIESQMVESQWT